MKESINCLWLWFFSSMICTFQYIYSAEQTYSSCTENTFRWFHSYRILLSAKTIVELCCWHFSHWKRPLFALMSSWDCQLFLWSEISMRFMVASPSRGTRWEEKLATVWTVRVVVESMRVGAKDAGSGWIVGVALPSQYRQGNFTKFSNIGCIHPRFVLWVQQSQQHSYTASY